MDTPKRIGRPPKPRPECAREGCTNHVKQMKNPYCSKSCSNRARDLPSQEERYWVNIGICPDTPPGCRDWLKSRDKDGYGLFALTHSQQIVASRYGLSLKLGRALLDHEKALHTCDRPPCQEPEHLFLGTSATNMADMSSKGRGQGHGSPQGAPVTDETVTLIRESTASTRTLATLLGISQASVHKIRIGARRRE